MENVNKEAQTKAIIDLMAKGKIPVKMMFIDMNIIGKEVEEVKEYLNTKGIIHSMRCLYDDKEDIEISLVADDIPNIKEFKDDLNISGNISHIEYFIFYNK
jgi:hypothetical protein